MSESPVDILLDRMSAFSDRQALVWHDYSYTYGWLLNEIDRLQAWLAQHDIMDGQVVLVKTDYSPTALALLLALWRRQAITVPYSQNVPGGEEYVIDISQAQWLISVDDQQHLACTKLRENADHPLYNRLRQSAHPGLVLFSSGTSGARKGIVHDVHLLLAKVQRIRPRHQRTLAFLVLDHLGGIDTLIYSLANAGCLVVPQERTPDGILSTIEKHGVQLLPTSPSFLNLVLLSGAYSRHDLTCLQKISYGAEAMPERLLRHFHKLFPHIKMVQSYALSELGVLRSTSESSESLWMTVGGDAYETRIVDGVLQVRSPNMMLGYLNAPNVMTDDGWFITGDIVEASGPYLRVRGRVSDIINVGGEKVNPLEVEDVIRELEQVKDVLVFGEANAILGQIVSARVVIAMPHADAIKLIRMHCLSNLAKYKVPMRIEIVAGDLAEDHIKRTRR